MTLGKMRVLHVILHVNQTNGQYNEHCLPLLEEREISVCTYFSPELETPPDLQLFPGDGTLRTFLRQLKLALSQPHDVVHVHAPQSGALVVVALMARFRLHVLRESMVYTVQDSFYDYSRRNQLLMAVALVGFKRIIFCSRAALESLPWIFKLIVMGRWNVVPNGADIDRVDQALAMTSIEPTEEFEVISVGRLEPVKDHKTLLEAFSRLPGDRLRLVIVGAGSLEATIRERIEQLSLADRVEVTGLIPRDDVFVRCDRADVFVSASHGEGLPVAVIEAMAARCPVVLSDIPPHRELAEGASFIPLVAKEDIDGFTREIERMRSLSLDELQELGRLCREHVLARFTLPIMRRRTDDVYRMLPTLTGVDR